VNCHDVHVRQVQHHIFASCHCLMKGALTITEVHDVTAALETELRKDFRRFFV